MKRTQFDYTVRPVALDESTPNTNVVIWDVPAGSETEVLHVTGSIAMQVAAISGEGEVVVHRSHGERHIRTLGRSLGAVTLSEGDTYQYLSTGDEPLEVLDECSPPFQDGDEISLEPASLSEEPEEGDYYLLWSQREPRQIHPTGAWRVVFFDKHDTTAYNQARAGQPKHISRPSHWHAAAQRAGERDIWPVNVQIQEGVFHMDLHAQDSRTLLGVPPSFAMPPNPTAFRRIEAVTGE